MNVRYLPAAETELDLAIARYERKRPGLGIEFRDEVDRIAALIGGNNWIGQALNAGTNTALRAFVFGRFPYRAVYCVDEAGILIVALAHQQQRPRYWRHRVEEPPAAYEVSLAA